MAKPCLSTCHVTTLIAATDFVLCNFVLPRHAAVLAYSHCFVCFCCCLFVRHGDQLLSCGGGCCGEGWEHPAVRLLCCFMMLAGHLHDARHVAEECMVQGLSRKRQKQWEAASFPEQLR